MSSDVEFRQALVDAAAAVMRCDYCCSHAPSGDQPQPGWVGSRYIPGRGAVVILQNPGAAPKNYTANREARAQEALRRFREEPNIKTHEQLMCFMLADMAGKTDGKRWKQWTFPVSKLILDQERLAWLNVVKFRTLGTTRKDGGVTLADVTHGTAMHLRRELEILKPKAVLTIGSEARQAVEILQLSSTVIRGHLKLQGASGNETRQLRQELLNAGVDVG